MRGKKHSFLSEKPVRNYYSGETNLEKNQTKFWNKIYNEWIGNKIAKSLLRIGGKNSRKCPHISSEIQVKRKYEKSLTKNK